jgi:hypothetical protein
MVLSADVKNKISDYCDSISKAFHPVYDPHSLSVTPSRHVVRAERSNEGLVAEQVNLLQYGFLVLSLSSEFWLFAPVVSLSPLF